MDIKIRSYTEKRNIIQLHTASSHIQPPKMLPLRPSGSRRFVFQQKLVKIPTLRAPPMVHIKIEPGLASARDIKFENVDLDGTVQPLIEIPAAASKIMYGCNSCDAHYYSRHMLEEHSKQVHGIAKKPLRPIAPKPAKEPVLADTTDVKRYAGYYKKKNGLFACSYCEYEAIRRTTVASHSTRKHSALIKINAGRSEYSQATCEAPPDDRSSVMISKTEVSEEEEDDEDDEAFWPTEVVEEMLEDDLRDEPQPDEEALRASLDDPSDAPRRCPYCPYTASKCSAFHAHVKRKHRQSWLKLLAEKVAALKPSPEPVVLASATKRRNALVNELDDDDVFGPMSLGGEVLEEIIVGVDGSASVVAAKEYNCTYCPFTTAIKSTFSSHVLRRHGSEKVKKRIRRKDRGLSTLKYTGYACQYCTFIAATVASINRHYGREHAGLNQKITELQASEFDCDQCGYQCKGRKLMQAHLKSHRLQSNPDGTFSCQICSYETLSRMGLQRHISIKHLKSRCRDSKSTIHLCTECDFTTYNLKILDWHKKQHEATSNAREPETNFFCNDCNFTTWNKDQLFSHIKRKHKEGEKDEKEVIEVRDQDDVLTCDQCDYSTKNKHVMKVHVIRKHTDQYNHECDQCGKKYKVKADLTNHIRFQHREQPIMCDVCGKECRNSNLLYLHQKFAHYKPEFECPICHRRMVSQANLDDHILKQHEQQQEFVCEECGKTFTKAARLKIHKRVHTGVKPYTCKICLKAFARRNGLRQHLLIHSGQRPYLCDICGKTFTQKTGLISHRKSHPGSHPPLPRVTIDHVLSDLLNEEEV